MTGTRMWCTYPFPHDLTTTSMALSCFSHHHYAPLLLTQATGQRIFESKTCIPSISFHSVCHVISVSTLLRQTYTIEAMKASHCNNSPNVATLSVVFPTLHQQLSPAMHFSVGQMLDKRWVICLTKKTEQSLATSSCWIADKPWSSMPCDYCNHLAMWSLLCNP